MSWGAGKSSLVVNVDHAILVFGSKVLEGGIPSGSLRRRTLGAFAHAQTLTGTVCFIVSGGIGTHPPAEAAVMRSLLLEAGADEAQIILDAIDAALSSL